MMENERQFLLSQMRQRIYGIDHLKVYEVAVNGGVSRVAIIFYPPQDSAFSYLYGEATTFDAALREFLHLSDDCTESQASTISFIKKELAL